MSNLIRRVPSTPFPAFSRDMSDLVDRFFTDFSVPRWAESKEMTALADWQPRVNMKETDQEYIVQAELPGMTEDQIEVSVENNTLYLKGERRFEKKDSRENFHRVESGFGTFFRAVPFPGKIASEKVAAELRNGVLTISAAKAPEVINSSRKIQIRKV